jgi:hypothetical protein
MELYEELEAYMCGGRPAKYNIIFLLFVIFACLTSQAIAAIVADHVAAVEFDSIPQSYIEAIDSSYRIYYVHTSHGSQIVTGINMLYDENTPYDPPYFYEYSDDLGHTGDTSWVPATRLYLEQYPECNMAMFSWCGGCSDNTEAGINIYLDKMNELEFDYPEVIFIYMTGHLNGGGVDGNLYRSNNQIRDYCILNDKILFDFADIESYDPDGICYPDETDVCYWCYDWCALYSCPTCAGCAHSHCFNCYQKGKAWWWMMARISGWNPNPGDPICGDVNGDEIVNLFDATYLIAFLYSGGSPPDNLELADVNGDGRVNIFDVTFLVAYLYKNGPVPDCP